MNKVNEELNGLQTMGFTSMELPMDWGEVFVADERVQGVQVDSISDGLIMSLSNLGKVDIEYIAAIAGASNKEVIGALRGSIYQNPETWEGSLIEGWETADEYLSGNIMSKWKAAVVANNEYKGYFEENVKALESIFPDAVAPSDIYVTLGSPWLPSYIIDDFITHMFGELQWYRGYISAEGRYRNLTNRDRAFATKHDEVSGTWEIPYKNRYDRSIAVTNTYGTIRVGALFILENTLNMKTVKVTEEISDPNTKSGKRRVINRNETLAAIEKQQKMIQEFKQWIWTDRDRRNLLVSIFENKYGCVKRRIFNGSFLSFPGMSQEISLFDYQKNAVARILFSPNTLLAHDVGAGKTYVMIAAGQELRRMGLSKKNMYVVPNNIVHQWRDIFMGMYPDAKLLCVDPKAFAPKKRQAVLKQIRDEEYDGIIIAYSCFEMIPVSKQYYVNELGEEKAKLLKSSEDEKKATSKVKKRIEKINQEITDIYINNGKEDQGIYFDELGINRLFVDEAHNYKNVPITTQANMVLGISNTGSKKCKDMMTKVHMVQKMNDGKGVVMATGTPITNSVVDAFVMQEYLQSGELALLDLQNFDAWIGMFAEKQTQFEIDVDTNSYRLATRFSKFHNLPELTALLSSIADFHQVDEEGGVPEFEGYQDSLIGRTPEFCEYLKDISSRAEEVRNGNVCRSEDNMLMITTDGRKAALDIRLVMPDIVASNQSKVMRCAENVADIYFKTAEQKSTQLVFSDISTPKEGFNIYDELKRLLVEMGVDEKDIAYAHSADTESKRAKLFEAVRAGDIRVIIGSTVKFGIGVNVQDKLIALHHLDVPWKPSDMTQREGRILRQGNENKKVYIYRYITEGSFDAYSWQLLETKQRFITDLLSGSMEERSGSDIVDTVLDYAEVKALAVGNPLVKDRVEVANELTRYRTLQRKYVEARNKMESELRELPAKCEKQKDLIERCLKDVEFYADYKEQRLKDTSNAEKTNPENRAEIRETINKALLKNVMEINETKLFNYRGFDIVLPANMKEDKPYIWLVREGQYYVELGDTATGNLIRIDNYLEGLDKHLEELEKGLKKFEIREEDITQELALDEDYVSIIEQHKQRLADIDRQLGVDE